MIMQIPRTIAWNVLLLLTFAVCLNSVADELSIKKEDGRVYLVKKDARLLMLDHGQWMPIKRLVHLPDDYLVALPKREASAPDVVVSKDGKLVGKISLRETLDKWLKDDNRWGGHKNANDIRYMHKDGGGILGFITNTIPLGQSVIALLSWYANGPSSQPVKAQHIIRIRVQPKPAIEPLRQLLDIPYDWNSFDPVPRLFLFGKRLLLYTKPGEAEMWSHGKKLPPSELLEITPEGKTVRVYAKLPPRRYPIGLLDQRWLILGEPNNEVAQPLWIYDLHLRKLSPLPGDWKGYFSVYMPEKGRSILIHKDGEKKTFVVTIPGGKRVALPNPTKSGAHCLWQDMAMIYHSEDNEVFVYTLDGRLIKRLRLK